MEIFLEMFPLSVGAICKNESHCIREWIEHYLFHGVSHFYIIDDGSTDNTVSILREYESKGIVSLFCANWKYYLGRQRDMYNHYILPHVCESEWLLMVDVDEFVWSPMDIDLRNILKLCSNLSQIQFGTTLYGSNGHIQQPTSLVAGFTKRTFKQPTDKCYKYFINSKYKFTSLNIHHATFQDKNDENGKFLILNTDYFRLNHYRCQSREFWNTVKCTRGDGDAYCQRTPDDFEQLDCNEVEDLGLYEQNKPLLPLVGEKML